MSLTKLRSALAAAVLPVAAFMPLLAPAGTARAFSSCPTDPLSALTPYEANYNDSAAVDVGVKFNVHGAPFVRGVKFYKGTDNTGTHVAHLFDYSASTELASATYTSETSTGWQTVNFSSDVPVDDTHTFGVWVEMPDGHYAVDGAGGNGTNNFGATPGGHGQFGTADDVVVIPQGNSGIYEYEPQAGVPSNTTDLNYWVSPIVGDTTAPSVEVGNMSVTDDASGPSVDWDAPGADTNAATSDGTPVRTAVERIQGESSDWIVGSQSGDLSSWSDGPNDPTALPGTAYTYKVINYDGCGNASSGATDTVTTASQSLDHIFSGNPANTDTGQTDPLTVGLRWHADEPGYVWGVRVYRASGTQYTGSLQNFVSLWDTASTTTAMATRNIPHGNNQSGWIDVRFDAPVAVDANHDYVVGYLSRNGLETYTNGTLSSDVTNSHLTAVGDTEGTPNGVYSTSGGYPGTRSGNDTWYGLDVDWYPAP
ncbi:MAG TPA: DUF4082 domain-containing protein [Candidatus Saccharimonadia bacterium]|nr:DUF4082 domain-containing protein [Candidatus Saccharimonadia bacterium]